MWMIQLPPHDDRPFFAPFTCITAIEIRAKSPAWTYEYPQLGVVI